MAGAGIVPDVPVLLPEPGAMPCGAVGAAPEAVLAGIAGTMAGGVRAEGAPGLPFGLLVNPPELPEACATFIGASEREVATAGALRLDSMPTLLSAAAGRHQAAAVVINRAAGIARKVRVFMRKTSSSS